MPEEHDELESTNLERSCLERSVTSNSRVCEGSLVDQVPDQRTRDQAISRAARREDPALTSVAEYLRS